MDYIKDITQTYNLLGDKESKEIFANRLLYSLTGDSGYIRKVICTKQVCKEAYQKMKTAKQIGIFGAGDIGRHLVKVYDDVNFVCFIDNKKAGGEYCGLPVLSLEVFKKMYPEGRIVISTKLYWEPILQQLLDSGYDINCIINLGKEYIKLNHLQYFDLPYLEKHRSEKEIFVDGGAYDGDTSVDFLKWYGKNDGKIFVWEPDKENLKKCRTKLEYGGVQYEMIEKGLWDKKEKLRFSSDGTGSAVSESGEVVIDADSIDNCMNSPVTFVKMDVEGAEYKALLGAEKIIRKYKPKLAVCIYHKPEDIWEIPSLIHSFNQDYTYYLRHYSFADNETVLYAL